MIDDKDIESFFSKLKDFDSNMMVIKEFKNEIVKRQGRFSDSE